LNLHLRSHWQNRDGAQNSDCEPTKVGIHKHASRVDFVPNSTAHPYHSFALTFPQLTGMGVMKTDKTTPYTTGSFVRDETEARRDRS